MKRYTAGIGATLLGFFLALVHFAPTYVNRQLVVDSETWFPQLETINETVVFYDYVSRGVAVVLAIGLVFALGYWVGLKADLRGDYRRFATVLGLGGMLGYVAALGVFQVTIDDPRLQVFVFEDTLPALLLLGRTVSIALQFAVIGFAGAAYAAITGTGTTAGGDSGIPTGSHE